MKKFLSVLSFALFTTGGAVSAQEVFNKVLESAQHTINEPTSSFTNAQIARFKVDVLQYMKSKALEKESANVNELLDIQAYYMSEFLSLFYTEIIYSTELSVGSLPSVVYRITALGLVVLTSNNPSFTIIPGGDTRKLIPRFAKRGNS